MALTSEKLTHAIANAKAICGLDGSHGQYVVHGSVSGTPVREPFFTERGAMRGLLALRARHIAAHLGVAVPHMGMPRDVSPHDETIYMALFAKSLK